MKTTKKIETFHDGTLVSSKVIETCSESNKKHPKVYTQESAHLLKLRETFTSFENVMKEARSLRKQLILKESEANARLKERDALKGALSTRDARIALLEEKVEDLSAQLHAAQEDLSYFEAATQKTSQQNLLQPPRPTSAINLLDDDDEDTEPTKRAIAAKPVKK